MNKFCLIRFDVSISDIVTKVLFNHISKNSKYPPALIGVPGSFITMFESEHCFDEIDADLKESISNDNTYMFLQLHNEFSFIAPVAHLQDHVNLFLGKENKNISYEKMTIEKLLELKEKYISEENYEECEKIQNVLNKVK